MTMQCNTTIWSQQRTKIPFILSSSVLRQSQVRLTFRHRLLTSVNEISLPWQSGKSVSAIKIDLPSFFFRRLFVLSRRLCTSADASVAVGGIVETTSAYFDPLTLPCHGPSTVPPLPFSVCICGRHMHMPPCLRLRNATKQAPLSAPIASLPVT